MATEQQLKEALIKADAAGDTVAANLFASKIKGIRAKGAQAQQQPEPTLGEQIGGGLETAATMVSGAIAEPIAGLAGIVQSLNPFADEGAGAQAVEATREALTYQGGDTSQEQLKAIGETLVPVGNALSNVNTVSVAPESKFSSIRASSPL